MNRLSIGVGLLVIALSAGCSKKACPDPQQCLAEASGLYQKAEATQDKFDKRAWYKESCSKFFTVFQARPNLFGESQYKEAKWACFHFGDSAKSEALATAEETFKAERLTKKK